MKYESATAGSFWPPRNMNTASPCLAEKVVYSVKTVHSVEGCV